MKQTKHIFFSGLAVFVSLLLFSFGAKAQAVGFFSDCTDYDPPNSYCSGSSVCTGAGEKEVGAGSMQECNGNACCVRPASTSEYTGGKVADVCSHPEADNYGSRGDCVFAPGAGGRFPDSSGATSANSGAAVPSAGIYIPGAETGLPAPSGGIPQVLGNFVSWLLAIVGIVALIGFVVSGTQYILASGNQDIMETAKRNLTYSIIGIVVVLASFVIIQAIYYALSAQSMF